MEKIHPHVPGSANFDVLESRGASILQQERELYKQFTSDNELAGCVYSASLGQVGQSRSKRHSAGGIMTTIEMLLDFVLADANKIINEEVFLCAHLITLYTHRL